MAASRLTTERSFRLNKQERANEVWCREVCSRFNLTGMRSMKPKAYLFVFDGLADWEPALALCEIRKSGKYDVLAAAHSSETVVTMGGLKVVPDITIDQI